MNKIILDNESVINLDIVSDSICNINNFDALLELNININDDKKLIINEYSEINEKEYKINIIQGNNTEFLYNHSFKSNNKYNLKININLEGNNSKNVINIHGLNDSGKSYIDIDGNVKKDTIDNELYENIKILNVNNGEGIILPNMYIDTKNVVANHAASITSIDKNYLFYLNSKGIEDDIAQKIIIDGFLKNDARDNK